MKKNFTQRAEEFVRSKYLHRKEYTTLKLLDNTFILKGEKEKKITFVEDLEELKEIETDIITESNKKNVEWLLKNWEKVINKTFNFYFLGRHYWAINPKSHSKIVDRKNLRKSLMSLLEHNK